MCLLIWTVFYRWVMWPMGLLFYEGDLPHRNFQSWHLWMEWIMWQKHQKMEVVGFKNSLIFSYQSSWHYMFLAFLIKICLLFVVLVILNFSQFHLLLKYHWTNFNQTWHTASLGDDDSSLFNWRALPYSKGRLLRNSENTLTNFKNLLLQNDVAHGPLVIC